MDRRASSRFQRALALALGMGLVFGLGAVAAPASAATASLSGHVYLGSASVSAAASEVAIRYSLSTNYFPKLLGTATTDANGDYVIPGLQAGGSYSLEFDYLGAGPYSGMAWGGRMPGMSPLPILASGTTSGKDITLPTRAAVTGSVSLGTSGVPAGSSDVSVSIRSIDAWRVTQSSWGAPVPIDAVGGYAFPQLQAGVYQLKFNYLGAGDYQNLSPETGELMFEFRAGADLTHDVVLPPTLSISGTMRVSGSNLPLAGATVNYSYNDLATGFGPPIATGITTDASGRYTISGLDRGLYNLIPSFAGGTGYMAPDSENARLVDVSITHDFRFDAVHVATGHVNLGGPTRSAVEGEVKVQFLRDYYGGEYVAFTDANGNYTMPGLPDSTYTIVFTYLGTEGFVPWVELTNAARVSGSNLSGLNATFAKSTGISGVLENSTGELVADARVTVLGFPKSGPRVYDVAVQFSTYTSPSGEYAFYSLPVAYDYEVYFDQVSLYADMSWPGYSQYYLPDRIPVSAGEMHYGYDATMYRPGSISGAVSVSGADLGTSGSAWLEVAVFDYATRKWVRTGDTYAAASNGSYRIDGLYPDLYRIWAFYIDNSTGQTGSMMSGTFDVAEGGSISYSAQITAGMNADEARAASKAYVSAAYEDVLGRVPSSRESNYWVDTLANGASRATVASGFNNSDEYRLIKIRAAYRDVLGREGEDRGVQYWLGLMRAGMIQPDDVHRTFLSSDEFYNRQGGGTPAGYVAALYRDQIGREPDVRGAAYWVGVLESQGRGTVVNGLWYSTETYQKRVSDAYALLLGRAPEGSGLDFWVGVARSNGLTEMRTRIMSSAEYFALAQLRF